MPVAMFLRGRFDSGDLGLFTGLGEVEFDGVTYRGVGSVMSIGETTSSTESGKSGITVTLSGVDPEILAITEVEEFQRRRVTIYLAEFSEDGALQSAQRFFDGLADDLETNDDPAGPVVTLFCEQRAMDLRRARPFKYLPEDQKKRAPGDTFFDLVSAIQNRDDIWGD